MNCYAHNFTTSSHRSHTIFPHTIYRLTSVSRTVLCSDLTLPLPGMSWGRVTSCTATSSPSLSDTYPLHTWHTQQWLKHTQLSSTPHTSSSLLFNFLLLSLPLIIFLTTHTAHSTRPHSSPLTPHPSHLTLACSH